MYFVSPPFGNYFPKTERYVPIRGSFTLNPRPGLLWKILSTVRYSFEYQGVINNIGLRNRGIKYALKTYSPREILSIAVLDPTEISEFLNVLPESQNLEINVSCPNVQNHPTEGIEHFLNPSREWCIVKLGPQDTNEKITKLYNLGFRQFHCCNTLPTENGGVSGPVLKKYTMEKIKFLKNNFSDTVVIAGGGVRSIEDAEWYTSLGADHISVSTGIFKMIFYLYF